MLPNSVTFDAQGPHQQNRHVWRVRRFLDVLALQNVYEITEAQHEILNRKSGFEDFAIPFELTG